MILTRLGVGRGVILRWMGWGCEGERMVRNGGWVWDGMGICVVVVGGCQRMVRNGGRNASGMCSILGGVGASGVPTIRMMSNWTWWGML